MFLTSTLLTPWLGHMRASMMLSGTFLPMPKLQLKAVIGPFDSNLDGRRLEIVGERVEP